MISRDERKSIGISSIASIVGVCAVVLPVGWFLVKPALADSIADQMKGTIDSAVQAKIQPLNVGFKAILQQNIDRLRRDIDQLENKQRSGALTEQELRNLSDKRIDLDGQRAALDGIMRAERG